MKIKLNDLDLNKLDNLFNIDESNKTFADFLFDYIDNAKNISKKANHNLYKAITNHFEISKDFLDYFKPYNLKNNIKKLDVNEYKNNPYNKNIILDNVSDGLYKFEYQNFLPFEGFLCEDISNDNHYEITKIGYFETDYKYLTLSYDNNIWMLITPHEINTMKEAINNANGNVITFGLGLGYFAYMCSIKDNVNKVTIIEKDPIIIDLFKKHILDKFENKDKIEIINDDAISYLNNTDIVYDYGFIDLWRDTTDGLYLYVKMYQASLKHIHTTFDYWIENSMHSIIKRAIITVLYENINGIDVNSEQSYFDCLVNKIKELYKDTNITSFKQIIEMLSTNNIYNIIKNL